MRMLDYALEFARKGYHIFPVHEPIFKDGACIGCTCEQYRRTAQCKENHPRLYLQPGEHCLNPGKCPRVRWSEKSTTDEDTISKWWHWWPTSNIGIDCGKSGLLVFDADTYKEICGEVEDLIPLSERETITSLTGGGGEHYWYALGEKEYGNSTKGLPAGIDIRGKGGYIVAPPSTHKSGRRYAFEEGYGISELDPLPIPTTLTTILDACYRTTGRMRSQATPDAASVEHSLRMAERVLSLANVDHHGVETWGDGVKLILTQCPFNPEDNPHGEDRSAFVTIDAAGALAAGCHHNRCQHVIEDSKLSGWHLLKQLAGIDPSEGKPQDHFTNLLQMAREFVKSVSFREFIPTELQSRVGYRTDSTDTKLADALLDLAELAHNFTVYASYETLRDRAGLGSKSTVQAALKRLLGWFITRNDAAPAHDLAFTYSVNIQWIVDLVLRRSNAKNNNQDICVRSTQNENHYTDKKATDPFLAGRSRTAKRECLTERPLGETKLRVMDVLADGQGWTVQELTEETEKSKGGLYRATKELEEGGYLYSEREAPRTPKIYYLTPEAWHLVEERTPTMKTYRLSAERKERALEEEQTRAETRMDMAEKPKAKALYAQRRSEVIAQRRRVLAVIHPDWTEDEIIKWILADKSKARPWLDYRQRKATAAQRAEENKTVHAQMERTARDLARQGISGSQAYAYAAMPGTEYTNREAAIIAAMTKRFVEEARA